MTKKPKTTKVFPDEILIYTDSYDGDTKNPVLIVAGNAEEPVVGDPVAVYIKKQEGVIKKTLEFVPKK